MICFVLDEPGLRSLFLPILPHVVIITGLGVVLLLKHKTALVDKCLVGSLLTHVHLALDDHVVARLLHVILVVAGYLLVA